MLNREEAFVLIKKYIKDENLIKYSIYVEAIMKQLARFTNSDEELWSIVGLLHNLDFEYTLREPEKRGTLSAMLLEELLPESGINAIKANNYIHTDYIPTTYLDKALISVDAVTSFIIKSFESIPSKKLSDLTLDVLLINFKDPDFAESNNKSRINLCNDIGIEVKDFLELSLNTFNHITEDLYKNLVNY
jgi:predicted hydrolase (HD superfamily)